MLLACASQLWVFLLDYSITKTTLIRPNVSFVGMIILIDGVLGHFHLLSLFIT